MPRELTLRLFVALTFLVFIFHFTATTTCAQTTFIVSSIGDSGDDSPGDGVCDDGSGNCTLRAAIEEANASAGNDIVAFNIGGAGVHTIQPLFALPIISDPIFIDGYTQPGASPNTNPPGLGTNAILKIELDGSAGSASYGLTISAGNSTVRGLVINRFTFEGIVLHSNGFNVIQGNFIGTDATGTMSVFPFNNATGITSGSPNTTIGGLTPDSRNVISGQYRGIQIYGSNCVIQGNFIGTDATGTLALTHGNTNGIRMDGATNITIGGTTAEARNIVSGNGYGVVILGDAMLSVLVQGNFIGTDVTGTIGLSNLYEGILAGAGVVIGGSTSGAGNVISNNGFNGLSIASNNLVQGNFIGTDATGVTNLGNGFNGIAMWSNNTIGGTQPGAGNVISGNSGSGIHAVNGSGNLVQGNFIGTNVSGNSDLGNGGSGLYFLVAPNNTVGGTDASARNLISGNGRSGIEIIGSGGNVIQGNFIGTDASGTASIGNSGGFEISGGVYIDAPGNIVGGLILGSGNLISGNNGSGVVISGSSAVGNLVQGNLIGTDISGTIDLGNSQNGVFIFDGYGNSIGGLENGARNIIAFNKAVGVNVRLGTSYEIKSNSIHSNTILGIDLGSDGSTANDPEDADIGPNNFQNFPEIGSAQINGNGDLIIDYSVDSDPTNSNYPLTIQFFESDPSAQGKTLLANNIYSAANFLSGNKTINLGNAIGLGIFTDKYIVATAIDEDGNSSEFSVMAAAGVLPNTIINPDTMYAAQIRPLVPMPASALIGNLIDGHSVQDIDLSSILINGVLVPSSATVITSHPVFLGEALELTFPIRDFLLTYGLLWDVTVQDYTVSGLYSDESEFELTGQVTLVGHRSGDVNLDGAVTILDLNYLINSIFRGGPPPQLSESADINHDGPVNIVDLNLLVGLLFR
ncbi:MAG TPA: dockerin type I domain-containing protein [candidate division Zixibacteria bacterium]|nr:dockerin type I domain-containing protein [candidate division Zixibacteria bacterium]